ncbi:hypothetical protein NST63_18015 [Heyndrickxia sp. FSL W8-0496]|uniref:hypothetical protein n=1 Tax=Heyndrickxia sp. FSL W8-0496 TaxID=2954702 RepID=UPI0030F9E1DF
MEVKSGWSKKIKEFHDFMKERGYTVEVESLNQFVYDIRHIVTKDDHYYVSIEEKMIIEAPIEYLTEYVEKKFKLLEGNE